MRAVYRELSAADNGGSGSGGAIDKFANALAKLGDSQKDVLIRAFEMQVTAGKPVADDLLEAQAARVIQDEVDISEIGEDTDEEDSVDFFEQVPEWEPSDVK